jgi:hypothetical protein
MLSEHAMLPDHSTEECARSRPRAWRRWLAGVLLLLICLWVAGTAIPLLIRHTRLQQKLTTRLEAAFGRPVEVGNYNFSLWGGPTLEARSVTVNEDPRFGHEYFLRAESINIRLRWQSLLRGHLELGTLSLSRPSLNVVRGEDGDWNLAEWLPRSTVATGQRIETGPARGVPPGLHFQKIEVNDGRINFKRGDEKLPFAFVGVKGAVETESPGRWRMDLVATPWRAAVVVQQAGVLHLVGHVGGTSSRLRPVVLDLSWTDASITDTLRLARSYDYGVHGTVGLSLALHTQGDTWMLEGRAELRHLHRWDLVLRPDDPSLNISAKVQWDPAEPTIQVTDATFEAPHSHARAFGRILLSRPPFLKGQDVSPVYFEIASSTINLADAFSWVRAFHSGVADDVSLQGTISTRGVVSGWPLRVLNVLISSEGAVLAGPHLPVRTHLGRVQFRYDHGLISFLPATISLTASDHLPQGSFHIETSPNPNPHILPGLHLSGSITEVRNLVAIAGSLGWNVSRGWDVAGPVRCDLRWQGPLYPRQDQPVGALDWGGEISGGSLLAPFLNRPVEQIKAHADFKSGANHIMLASAQAFGAHWNGTLNRSDTTSEWQFALSADRLTAADIDRWLNPLRRESLLDRVLPFLASRSSSNGVPENLRVSGKLTVDQFVLAPLSLRRLQGDLRIEGRHIELTNAEGQFYGGHIGGSLDERLDASPTYSTHLTFSGVDLSALTASTPGLADLFAGSASGNISINARGATQGDLLASLECRGAAQVSAAQLRGINLAESLRQEVRRSGTSTFRQAFAAFTCGGRRIQFRDFQLVGSNSEMRGIGSVDFSRNTDLRLRVLSGTAAATPNGRTSVTAEGEYQLTGLLSRLQIARIPTLPRLR